MASTNQDTAYWEVQETRDILAGLSEIPHKKIIKMSRAHWGCFDFLVDTVGFHPSKLIDIVEEEAALKGMAFADVFPDAMAYMDRELSKEFAEDE